ncbi:hypothetical protein IG631_06530 [Alternaria alternata]|nr:hypothetical protein IG631_06530 [Alternaria alternata]
MAGSCGNDHPQVLVLKEPLPFSDEDVTFRLLSLNVCCTLASLAVGLSVFHIMQHALHCLRLWEQKHIIRILAVIPVYAWTTFFSYLFFGGAVYWELIRECYAAYATVSFFTLMCHYIAPNLHEQKNYFRSAEPKNWGWPLNWVQKLSGGEHKGWLRKPRCGVTWFNVSASAARIFQTFADVSIDQLYRHLPIRCPSNHRNHHIRRHAIIRSALQRGTQSTIRIHMDSHIRRRFYPCSHVLHASSLRPAQRRSRAQQTCSQDGMRQADCLPYLLANMAYFPAHPVSCTT